MSIRRISVRTLELEPNMKSCVEGINEQKLVIVVRYRYYAVLFELELQYIDNLYNPLS